MVPACVLAARCAGILEAYSLTGFKVVDKGEGTPSNIVMVVLWKKREESFRS